MAESKTGVQAFTDEALPKSGAGRKADPIDTAFADTIVAALKERSTVEVDGEVRPRVLGSSTDFPTRGKASSAGTRYRAYIRSKLEVEKLSVNAYGLGAVDDKGNQTGPFRWRVYIPLSAS